MTSSPAWMPLYVADYLADTGHLSAAEHGAYMLLIMHYWRQGSLPTDEAALSRIARMNAREWARSRDTIAAFFDSEWKHERIEKEMRRANVKSDRRAQAGSRGGHAKALKSHNADLANASELPSKSPSKTLPSSSEFTVHSSSSLRSDEPRARNSAFVRFWNAYPEKVGKKPAERAFSRVWRQADEIIAGVERYKLAKPPDRNWMHPATFLNGERWKDEHAPLARAGPKQRETAADVMAELRERAHAEKSGGNRGNNEPTSAREPGRESPTLDLSKPTGSEPWGAGFDFVQSRAYAC